jgi:hypothetical protein
MSLFANYYSETYPIYNTFDGDLYCKRTENSYNTAVNIGFEKRYGETRFQFYWGIDGSMGVSQSKIKIKYEQELLTGSTAPNILRSLGTNQGLYLNLGTNVFAGVEYFFLPKWSVGAELGWGISYQHPFKGYEEIEKVESGVYSKEQLYNVGSTHQFRMDRFSGSIFFMYHF